MITLQSHLSDMDLHNKHIFVRIDANIAEQLAYIPHNEFRLQAVLPTLQYIQKKGGKILLCTHEGNPDHFDAALSTEPLAAWFTQAGFSTTFAQNIEQARITLHSNTFDIVVLENIRFFPEESACSLSFAEKLTSIVDYYINDAFGSCHRQSATLTVMPTLFDQQRRSIGFLIEKELQHINPFINHQTSLTMLIGGIKGTTKIPLLTNFLHPNNTIIISTPLCFTFFKVLGQETGTSYVEKDALHAAEVLLKQAQKNNMSLIFPQDFQISKHSFDTPKKLYLTNVIAPDECVISIGPRSTALFKKQLLASRMIFLNGLPGNKRIIESLEATRTLLYSLHQFSGQCIIGGGDSISLVQLLGLYDIGFLSTGGGATLAYMSQHTLPALMPFMQ